MVGRSSDVGSRNEHPNHSSSRHSIGGHVKTRHSTGGVGSGQSRLRTGGSTTKSTGISTVTARKRYSESRKLDSPEAEPSDVDIHFSQTAPGVTTVLRGGGPGRRSSASSRNKMKTTALTTATVTKPISPNPSESSTAASVGKTSCNSPDLMVGGRGTGSTQLDQMWSNIDTQSLQWENRHLKDLLVSQLDLIQQQSETIMSREKELKDLRIENELLCQRLDRMDRRMCSSGDSAGVGKDSICDTNSIPPSNSVHSAANSHSSVLKEASVSTQPLSTPSRNPRKRPFSATSAAEPSQHRSSTPPVIPAKRIKRESGGTYAIVTSVASAVPVRRKSQLTTTPAIACTSSILLPAKTSSAKMTPSLLPSKQQLKSAMSSTAAKSVSNNKEDVQSSASSSTTNEFLRFDELTDEIFEESDARFRICHEDAKLNYSRGDGVTCDSTILEQVVSTAASEKRRKSESLAPDSSLAAGSKERRGKAKQQRGHTKQTVQPIGEGIEGPENDKTPSNAGYQEPLFTSYHYHVGCMKELVNKDDKLTECSLLHQLGVEVPKFRKDEDYEKRMGRIMSTNKRNPYNRFKEELELLDDSVYLKRHEKPEQLEKKTKKWDMQRLRELQRVEKLRSRYDQSSSKNKKQQPDTLVPSPESAEILLICEDGLLPVSVFGQSVPNFMQSSFVLPWIGKKQGKSEASKRSRQSHLAPSSRSSKH